MRVTIITGLSGAGKSTALRALEDIDFLCTDNLPPVLIPEFVKTCMAMANAPHNIAIATDLRVGSMFDAVYDAIDALKELEIDLDIIFLDASDSSLISRYTQTRRKHPLSGSGNILSGIFAERDRLQRIKDMSSYVLDTSTYTNKQLANAIQRRYKEESDQRLLVSVISFGYKRGIPMDADLVFDMRFLPNPFYIEEFRMSTGMDEDVRNYVLGFEEAQYFLDKLTEMVLNLAPHYLQQDKKQLTIGIGCTGGMHRSVAMAEALHKRLSEKGARVTVEHRDINLEQSSVRSRFPQLSKEGKK
ncbi:MAG: RNase adapter RapZ [Clostridia bacterium]|nr:RNase adapter RapZ [Clostridia bacterium]MBR3295865.1 RNase adapter RapZ [Clostridia bacterium]